MVSDALFGGRGTTVADMGDACLQPDVMTAAVPTELTQHSAPDRDVSKPESADPVNRRGVTK